MILSISRTPAEVVFIKIRSHYCTCQGQIEYLELMRTV